MSSEHLPSVNKNFNALLIGGGKNYGSGNISEENDPILDTGLMMTGLGKPNVLIVPSARWKAEQGVNKVVDGYIDYYRNKGLGATVLHPFLYHPHNIETPSLTDLEFDPARVPSQGELEDSIGKADLLFVLGGDTNRMINQIWKPLGIDVMLHSAIERGAVMSGTSAGSVAWFEGGNSDSSSLHAERPNSEPTYNFVAGLGYIARTVVCPHYDATSPRSGAISREKSFHNMMYRRASKKELGIGIDDNTAIKISNGTIQAIKPERTGRQKVELIDYIHGKKRRQTLSPADGEVEFDSLI
jgi:peptidase E